MINVIQAIETIMENIPKKRIKELPLIDATGYTLAEDVISSDQLPRFTNSAMDGYAIRSEDTTQSTLTVLRVKGHIYPGDSIENLSLNRGETYEITTGAPIPSGADAVIMLEDVNRHENCIEFKRKIKPGTNIRYQGEDIRKGDYAVHHGMVVTPGIVALLAALGVTTVKVYDMPNVGIITTGSELVSPDQSPQTYQIRDANLWSLCSALRSMGITPVFTYRVSDTKRAIQSILSTLPELPDFVILTGGVSVGSHDYVKEEMEMFGVKQLFWKVAQKPGKPLYVGIKGETMVFALPGNPAAVWVCFYVYISSAIRRYIGRSSYLLPSINAELDKTVNGIVSRTHFLRANYRDGKVIVLDKQDSHMLTSLAIANALIVLEPRETGVYQKGESVPVWLIQ
jgi:molybdopterin molybdotransferase